MSGVELAMLIAAGGVGAGLRYLVDRALTARQRDGSLPLGTLAVNLAGSFLLGFLVGLGDAIAWAPMHILGIGLCGGLTTFSTVSVDSVRLARAGHRDLAWGNLLGTFVVCAGAAGIGLMLGGIRVV